MSASSGTGTNGQKARLVQHARQTTYFALVPPAQAHAAKSKASASHTPVSRWGHVNAKSECTHAARTLSFHVESENQFSFFLSFESLVYFGAWWSASDRWGSRHYNLWMLRSNVDAADAVDTADSSRQRRRVWFSALLLAALTSVAAAALACAGGHVLELVAPSAPWREALLQAWTLRRSGGGLQALERATRALQDKSALFNSLLAHGVLRRDSAGATGDARLTGMDRLQSSKVRLAQKFAREKAGLASGPPRRSDTYEELAQQPVPSSPSHKLAGPTVTDSTAGPLQRKINVLNNILDEAASQLGPEESDSYHAPETANLQDQVADIKDLAKEQNVLLPPLVPNSRVVQGARGLFAARIQGRVVNVIDGSPVEGATVELVGPNKPLPPNLVNEVASDGPLHPRVDAVLRNLARGFAVIGLKNERHNYDSTLGAYQVYLV